MTKLKELLTTTYLPHTVLGSVIFYTVELINNPNHLDTIEFITLAIVLVGFNVLAATTKK